LSLRATTIAKYLRLNSAIKVASLAGSSHGALGDEIAGQPVIDILHTAAVIGILPPQIVSVAP